jgi:hypothetical protein
MAHDHSQDRAPQHDASYTHNPGGAHEHRDINVRAIFGFLLTLGVAALLIQVVLFAMFKYLKGSYVEPQMSPLISREAPGKQGGTQPDPGHQFPQPRLQPDPVRDMNRLRVTEDKILHGPPVWLDENAGVVRIPIEQAMQLTLQRGLPTQPGAGPKPAAAAKKPEGKPKQ